MENDLPPPHLAIHFLWLFLEPLERHQVSHICSQWFIYAKLRHWADLTSVASLHLSRPPPMPVSKLPMDCALLYVCALLCFNFYYGDFLCWMGGEHTNQYWDWDTIFDKVQRL
jgi:hypothetical protein